MNNDIFDLINLDINSKNNAKNIVSWFAEKYFQIEIEGQKLLPKNNGPFIFIMNHSGPFPFEALLFSFYVARKSLVNSVYPLLEDQRIDYTFLMNAFNQIGVMRASRDNAQYLLESGNSILVFPEGVYGLNRTYNDQNLHRLGRGGFLKLASKLNLPIIPVVAIGGMEAQIGYNYISRLIKPNQNRPFSSILSLLTMTPMPSKWVFRFLNPIFADKNISDDEALIKSREIRNIMQDNYSKIYNMRHERYVGIKDFFQRLRNS